MAVTNTSNDLLGQFTAFRVDGEDYTGGPMTWAFHRWVAGFHTADAGAVTERLLVPGVCPLRLTAGRALMIVEGGDLSQQRTGLPPTRGAFVAVSAMVTGGPEPAPVALPLLGDRFWQRYQVVGVPLRFLITNPVEAQLFTRQFGFEMRIADIERRSGGRFEEFRCSHDGRPLLRLRVRTAGRTRRFPPVLAFYSVRDGQPFRMCLSNPDPGAAWFGRRASVLDLTAHDAVADLQTLRLSSSGWLSVSKTGSHWHAATPPELLGSAGSLARPEVPDFRAGRFTERRGAHQSTTVDDELDALPFDPYANFDVLPLPTSHR